MERELEALPGRPATQRPTQAPVSRRVAPDQGSEIAPAKPPRRQPRLDGGAHEATEIARTPARGHPVHGGARAEHRPIEIDDHDARRWPGHLQHVLELEVAVIDAGVVEASHGAPDGPGQPLALERAARRLDGRP